MKRSTHFLVTVVAYILLGFGSVSHIHAQAVSANGGSIQGTVTDPSHASLAGASITISSKETGFSRSLKADSAGFYSVGPLNPGTYQIEIEAPGFSKLLVETVVKIGTATAGSYQLSVGSSTTEVQVIAGAVQVNTEQPGVSGVITAQQIDSLPINGRNFLDLAQIEPGVQLQDGNSFDPTKSGYSALAVNGISGRTTRILLDGQDITDENVGTTIVNVSEGAIDEFQINHSTQDVSGDLTSTGQVLVSTRSGNNAFHGQAFYNFQDHDAGFATIEGVDVPFQRNQFGGRIGGPIFKDKLFFFANSERIKQEQSAASSLSSTFSGLQGNFPTIGSPFRETYSTARLDYNGPFAGHYFARIYYDSNASVSGTNYSLYSNRDNTPGIVGGADFVTGKFTHSFRGGYEKFHNLIGDATAGNSSLYNPIPALNIDFNSLGLDTGPNANAPQATFQSDKQIRYDGSWTHGAHNLRYGLEFNRLLGGGYASFFGLAPRAYLYASTLTDGGNAANPLDYAFRYLYVGNGEGYFSEKPGFDLPGGGQEDWRSAFYITDAWKVRPDLTLTAGIRYSRDTERANQDLGVIPCSAIDTNEFPDPICTGSSPLLDQFGAGLGKRVNQPNMNFGPQVGFAYSLGAKATTVIRGGFGVYYDSNIWNNILFDRENRLQKGLFNAYNFINCTSNPQIVFPGGNVVNSVNGVALSTLCTEPLSQSAPYIVALQQQYQTAVTAAGPALNPNFVGETLNIASSFYAPNYVSPYSLQMNFGVQHQLGTGATVSVDYVHSATQKIQQSIDVNHVGAARYLNVTAAQNAIASTLAANKWTSIDNAIANGAQIEDFMGNGLDSGIDYLAGNSALYEGLTPNTGAAFGGKNGNLGEGLFNFPSGRAGYDSLQVKLQEQKAHPIKGIASSNFQVSYNFSRIQTTSRGGSNAFFTAGAWNQDHATQYMGDADLDHRHEISFGGSFTITHGPQIGVTGHFNSAPPSNLLLDASTENNIFQTDVDGDGTTGDLLPGTNPGAYQRQYSAGSLKKAITNYNNTQAGTLTPAGQALVAAGVMTSAQLTQLNAVQQQIYNGSTQVFSNPMFKALDASITYPIRLKFISETATLEPAIAMYNVSNFANWNGSDGTLINVANAGSDGSGAYSYVNGTNGFDLKNQNRIQRGAGTFDQGGPRSTEFQLRFNF